MNRVELEAFALNLLGLVVEYERLANKLACKDDSNTGYHNCVTQAFHSICEKHPEAYNFIEFHNPTETENNRPRFGYIRPPQEQQGEKL